MPASGKGVAERLYRAPRIRSKGSPGNEQDPGRAKRQERVAVINDADADGPGGVVASAGCDDNGFHAPRRGNNRASVLR
jgi:hypothetical protein